MIGAIIKFPGSFANKFLRAMRNRFAPGARLMTKETAGLREAQMGGERFQAHTLSGGASLSRNLARLGARHRVLSSGSFAQRREGDKAESGEKVNTGMAFVCKS